MNNDKNNRRLTILVIILLVLVIILSGYLVYDKYYCSDKSQNDIENLEGTTEAEIQELISKTITGEIVAINDQVIKVKITQFDEKTGEDKTQEKEIKIDANTELKKYEPVDEGDENYTYQATGAKISDFKVGDMVNVLVDKNPSEADLTAVSIELVDLTPPEGF